METEVIPSEKLHRDTVKANERLPDQLPRPPFLIVVQGSAGSGKSSFTYSLLRTQQKAKQFDIILIFNRCKDSDTAWEEAFKTKKTEVAIFNYQDDAEMRELIEELEDIQEERRRAKERPLNVLFLFDDMVMSNICARGAGKPTALDDLVISRRHWNSSIILTSQGYHNLNPNIRTNNINMLVLLRAGDRDLKCIQDEHNSGMVKQDEFERMYRHVKDAGPQDQMVIDQTCPIAEMFKHGFDKVFRCDAQSASVKVEIRRKMWGSNLINRATGFLGNVLAKVKKYAPGVEQVVRGIDGLTGSKIGSVFDRAYGFAKGAETELEKFKKLDDAGRISKIGGALGNLVSRGAQGLLRGGGRGALSALSMG